MNITGFLVAVLIAALIIGVIEWIKPAGEMRKLFHVLIAVALIVALLFMVILPLSGVSLP